MTLSPSRMSIATMSLDKQAAVFIHFHKIRETPHLIVLFRKTHRNSIFQLKVPASVADQESRPAPVGAIPALFPGPY